MPEALNYDQSGMNTIEMNLLQKDLDHFFHWGTTSDLYFNCTSAILAKELPNCYLYILSATNPLPLLIAQKILG